MLQPKKPHYKILICEDDPGILEVICIALEALGHTYATHRSTDGLIKCIQKEEPDILLLDLWLGGKNGQDILPKIASERSGTEASSKPMPKIILMSAHSKLKDIAEQYGFSYLSKPFGLDDLTAILTIG
jgi:DNA-binding NtrC family response regulator